MMMGWWGRSKEREEEDCEWKRVCGGNQGSGVWSRRSWSGKENKGIACFRLVTLEFTRNNTSNTKSGFSVGALATTM